MKKILLAAAAFGLLAADVAVAQTAVYKDRQGDTRVVTQTPRGRTVTEYQRDGDVKVKRTSRRYNYGGRYYDAVRAPRWVAPRGWTYRRYAVGAYVPSYFLGGSYIINPLTFGVRVQAAGPNRHWIRVGDDLYLVNRRGRVIQVIPNVFYY